jgi:hypothetical protein
MVPGCIRKAGRRTEDTYNVYLGTPDELYPEHEHQSDALPGEIRDWLEHRKRLVVAWKSSYDEFRQRFGRHWKCYRDLYYGRTPWE